MWSTTLRSLRGHKRRFLATCTAVVLGVSFLAATLVLGDTVTNGFTSMFTEANAHTAALVRSSTRLGSDETAQAGVLPASVVDQVASVDGVDRAVASIDGLGQIAGRDGTAIGGDGPPTLAGNWIDDEELNPYHLVDGRAPADVAPGQPLEVVIDRGAADDGDLAVGDTTTVYTPDPVAVEVVGVAAFGDQDSMAGTTFAAFTDAEAQALLAEGQDVVSEVRVAAAPGVDEEQVAASVREVLPADAEVLTGSQLTAEEIDQIESDFLGAMKTFLLIFAGVALLVATFSIHNTFAILAAQRSKESALLRAIGATRRQVLGSVLFEAALVGVVASLVGLAVGIGLAAGLGAALEAADTGLPPSALHVTGTALVVAGVVGLVVTLVAGVSPAIGASRVAPVAAMQGAAIERVGASRLRGGLGVVVTAAGVALVAMATRGDGELGLAGLGALASVVGFLMLAPLIARPVSAVLGTPGRACGA